MITEIGMLLKILERLDRVYDFDEEENFLEVENGFQENQSIIVEYDENGKIIDFYC